MAKRGALLLFLTAFMACAVLAAVPGSAQSPPVQVPAECQATQPADPTLLPIEIVDLPAIQQPNSDLPFWTQGRLTADGQLVTDGGMSIQVQGPTGALTPGLTYELVVELSIGDGWTTFDGATGIPMEILGLGSSGLTIVVSGEQVRLGEPSLSIDGVPVGEEQRKAMLHVLPIGSAWQGVGEYLDDLSTQLAHAASLHMAGGRSTAGLRWQSPRDVRNSAQALTTCFGGSTSPNAMEWARRIQVTLPFAFDTQGRHTVTIVPDLRARALTIGGPGQTPARPRTAFEYRQQITVEFDVGGAGLSPTDAIAMLLFVGIVVLLGAGLIVFAVRQSRLAPAAVQVVSSQGIGQQFSLRKGQLTIGRDPRCGMVLADRQVSAFHALIQQGPQGFLLTDLKSANGTFVDGQRTQRAVLQGGELLRVGQTQLRFVVAGVDVAPSARPQPMEGVTAHVAMTDGERELARAAVTPGTVLGRHANSPIDLRAHTQVSREHARFEYQAGQWAIRDLDSRNGTFVNGHRVTVERLQDGDEVRLADVTLQFIAR